MKQYLTYFKLKFIAELQYRSAALAGIVTQFFFGFVYIMVYVAFYESNHSSIPMPLNQLNCYVWLTQALFSLIYLFFKEKNIINDIKSGNIAYELCKPGNLYFRWFSRIYATKLSNLLLKFFPIIIVGFFLPSPYNFFLPSSVTIFIGFSLTLLLASLLICSFITLLHVLVFYTIDADGVLNAFRVIAELFSGAIIPLPFFPKILQIISSYLPFQYMSDIPFRIYVGNVNTTEILPVLMIQSTWLIIMTFLGLILTKQALKKVVVQGG